jgi:hypothetical protein
MSPTANTLRGSLTFAPPGVISNPSGTYGATEFPSDLLDSATCECLTEICTRSSQPKFSNYDSESLCSNTYQVGTLITIGCMPPTAVAYFAYQTNVFSSFDSDGSVYFPEVSPLPSINHLTMAEASPNEPFVIITTASSKAAASLSASLVAAGVPESAITVDGLGHPDIKLGSDTLQAIVRLNNPTFGDDLLDYIASSADEQIVLYTPTPNPPSSDILPALPLRPRSSSDDEGEYEAFSASLDALQKQVQSKMGADFTLSYAGLIDTPMDYGYTATDTAECCLSGYFDEANAHKYWLESIHFSTNDCLYGGHGAWVQDEETGPELISTGAPLVLDYSTIGEAVNITSYSSFFCKEDSLQLNYQCATDSCDDTSCSTIDAARVPSLAACNPVAGKPYFSRYQCGGGGGGGGAVIAIFSDDKCLKEVSESSLESQCFASQATLSGEIWAGGYMRPDAEIVVIGVATNRLGRSSFHNIYQPSFGTYNDPTLDNNSFNEEELEGSAESWGATGGERGEVFAAQFGRVCANGDERFCKKLSVSAVPDFGILNFMSRQYLDPSTKTGLDKESLPLHRVLVFDKKR